MKRFTIAAAILGMAVFPAMSKDLTVVHYAPSSDDSRTLPEIYRQEFKDAMAEAGINNLSEVTKLTLISGVSPESTDEDGNTSNPICGIITGNIFLTQFPDNDSNDNLRTLLKYGLETLDCREAVFENNAFLSSSIFHNDSYPDFGKMEALINVFLPEGLVLIGGNAFGDCPKLTNVTIPNSVEEIGADAFRNCKSLKLNTLPSNLRIVYSSAFGYSANDKVLVNVTASELPDGVTNIKEAAFKGTAVTFSKLSSSLTEIGKEAFNDTKVSFSEFPDGITSIGETAFRNTNVTFKEFPKSLQTLGASVFVNCDGITEFTIPEVLWGTIPDRTFYPKTMALQRTFICRSKTPPAVTIGPGNDGFRGTFGNVTSFPNVTIYVPYNAEDNYKSQAPYSTMKVETLKFEEEQQLSDLFEFQFGDAENVNVGEIVDGQWQPTKFDKEGYYTLHFQPASEPMLYIDQIKYLEEDIEVPKGTEGTEEASLYKLALQEDDTPVGEVFYRAPDKLVRPVVAEIPLFRGSQKIAVVLAQALGLSSEIECQLGENGYQQVYNLQGIRVAEGINPDLSNLAPGTYIVRASTSARKVYIK